MSLVQSKCDQANNVLPVQVPSQHNPHRKPSTFFTVCVSPLHSGFNDANQLTQMIEANRIFGAEKFVFYNFDVGDLTKLYLRNYIQDGVIDVINWTLPDVKMSSAPGEEGVHYFGQLAALNDCLYRNIYKTRYVVYLDLDEVIVPKNQKFWMNLIRSIPNGPEETGPCSYLFPNVFFRTDWPEDPHSEPDVKEYQIKPLLYTKREKQVWTHGLRSKYIANVNRLEIAGVHFPWKCLRSEYNYHISKDQGLLHHYRAWEAVQEQGYIVDNEITKYKENLVFRVSYRHNKMGKLKQKHTNNTYVR